MGKGGFSLFEVEVRDHVRPDKEKVSRGGQLYRSQGDLPCQTLDLVLLLTGNEHHLGSAPTQVYL